MQFDFSEEWCKKAADLEGNDNVSAGVPMNITQVTHYPVLNRASIFDEYGKVGGHPKVRDKENRELGQVRSNLRHLRMIWNESFTEKVPDSDEDAIAFVEKRTLFGYPIKVDQALPYFEISVTDVDVPPARFTFNKYEEGPPSEAFKSALQAIRIAIIDHESPNIED